MTTFIKTPFADSGDKATIPTTDASGNVNWSQGFPADYSKDPDTDPSAKRIEREDFNGMMNALSKAINEIQKRGVASFITAADNGGSAFVYESGAIVYYNANLYQSFINNNNSLPTDSRKWNLLDTGLVTGKLIDVKIFTASGIYTPTPGTKKIIVEVQAGGGGSGAATGSANTAVCGQAGGGGGYGKNSMPIVEGQTAQITVGTGGGATAAGGNSAFVGYNFNIVAIGGKGGINSSVSNINVPNASLHARGALGGGCSGANILNSAGGPGTPSLITQGVGSGGAGGQSQMSAGSLGAGAQGGPGEQAFYGAGAGAATVNGAAITQPGAKGGDGLIIIWEYS